MDGLYKEIPLKWMILGYPKSKNHRKQGLLHNCSNPYHISSQFLPIPPAVATSRATFRPCRLSGRRLHGSCSAASALEAPQIRGGADPAEIQDRSRWCPQYVQKMETSSESISIDLVLDMSIKFPSASLGIDHSPRRMKNRDALLHGRPLQALGRRTGADWNLQKEIRHGGETWGYDWAKPKADDDLYAHICMYVYIYIYIYIYICIFKRMFTCFFVFWMYFGDYPLLFINENPGLT